MARRYGQRRRHYFIEHNTPAWNELWERVQMVLAQRGLDVKRFFDAMLYLGTWDGHHHFTSDPDRAPGGRVITFRLPVTEEEEEAGAA